MPSIIARIMVSLVVILSGPVIYLVVAFTGDQVLGRNDFYAFLIATVLTPVLVFAAWVGVWAGQVRWNGTRVNMTLSVLLLAWLIGLIIGYLLAQTTPYNGEILGMIFGSMVGALVWFGLTPLVWKETKAERNARVSQLGGHDIACPACGYNLTGLRQAKCPECGAAYTLDQLYANMREQAQPVEQG